MSKRPTGRRAARNKLIEIAFTVVLIYVVLTFALPWIAQYMAASFAPK